MSSPVSYEVFDNIGAISINNPPVNALSHAVRQGLYDAICAAQDDVSDAVGLNKVYQRILEFQERFGAEAWAPAPLLVKLAGQ